MLTANALFMYRYTLNPTGFYPWASGNVIKLRGKSTKLLNSLINKVIRKIRFYQRFRFSESVKSVSNFDADKTDLLRKNADKNGFIF
ncbi:hypothetical protein ASF10_04710 [Flavobacterium sp. Leaf82]|nr:hypothetical protein ASF10_04710 [Flavobacterium sp. Leaf82]